MPDDFNGTVYGKKSNGGLQTCLGRTAFNFYFCLFKKYALCVYGEYANQQKK
jgi:hypothetical protein